MTSPWQPFRESLGATLLRTGLIAVTVGAILARWWGGFAAWPKATLVVFCASFGGHWVEVWFLNWVRPRISEKRAVQVAVRGGVWFAAGVLLGIAMKWTAAALGGRVGHWPAWWVAGAGFIALELVVHLVMQVSGQRNFYNGRG